jgi:hypothetical protein
MWGASISYIHSEDARNSTSRGRCALLKSLEHETVDVCVAAAHDHTTSSARLELRQVTSTAASGSDLCHGLDMDQSENQLAGAARYVAAQVWTAVEYVDRG